MEATRFGLWLPISDEENEGVWRDIYTDRDIPFSITIYLNICLRWPIGGFDVLPQSVGEFKSLVEDGIGKVQQFYVGQPVDKDRSLGLFLNCKKPSGDQMGFFFGECLPNLDTLEAKFISEVKGSIMGEV